jgi:hypothetical protein
VLRQWLIDCDGIRFLAHGHAPAVGAEVAVRADHVIVLELVGVS